MFPSRLFSCLFAIVFPLLVAMASNAQEARNISEARQWLRDRASAQIRDCRRQMNDGTAVHPPQVGIGYEAFWLRDYAYILEGAADQIPETDLRAAVRVFLQAQREDAACVDCVKYDGTAIYKPGYGTMGENPVADGSQFTVAVAYRMTNCPEWVFGDTAKLPRYMSSVTLPLAAVGKMLSGTGLNRSESSVE